MLVSGANKREKECHSMIERCGSELFGLRPGIGLEKTNSPGPEGFSLTFGILCVHDRIKNLYFSFVLVTRAPRVMGWDVKNRPMG
jgi:hypothetical protein